MNSVEAVQSYVAVKMDDILTQFKPGCRITVMVRTPDHPDRDFLMTSDDLREAIWMIERNIARAAIKEAGDE